MISIIALASFEIVQGIELALVLAIAALMIVSLLKLGKITLPVQTKIIWALIIVVIPIFGALIFLVVKPGSLVNQT